MTKPARGARRRSGTAARKQAARVVDVDHARLRPIALALRADGYGYRAIGELMTSMLTEAGRKAALKAAKDDGKTHIVALLSSVTWPVGEEAGQRTRIPKDLAWKLVIEALAEQKAENSELAEQVKQIELERLDSYARRLNDRKDRDDPEVVRTLVRISESRRRLLGVDAPVSVQHSGAVGLEHVWDLKLLSDHELALLEWLHAKATAATAQPLAAMPAVPPGAPRMALPPGPPVVVVPAPAVSVGPVTP